MMTRAESCQLAPRARRGANVGPRLRSLPIILQRTGLIVHIAEPGCEAIVSGRLAHTADFHCSGSGKWEVSKPLPASAVF